MLSWSGKVIMGQQKAKKHFENLITKSVVTLSKLLVHSIAYEPYYGKTRTNKNPGGGELRNFTNGSQQAIVGLDLHTISAITYFFNTRVWNTFVRSKYS